MKKIIDAGIGNYCLKIKGGWRRITPNQKMKEIIILKSSLSKAIRTLKDQGFKHRFFLSMGLIKTPKKNMSVHDLYILEKISFDDKNCKETAIYGLITKSREMGYLLDRTGEFNHKLQQLVRK